MRKRLMAIGSVLALGVLAGCGNGVVQEAAERSPDPIVAAAGRSADEKTAAVAFGMQVGGATVTGEGVIDLAAGDRARLTLTAPGPAPTTVELRVVDEEVFVMVPGLEAQQPGKRWVRIDADATSGEPTGSLGFGNPGELLDLLGSATDFEESGTATVRGEQMTTWTGSLDLAELAEDGAGPRLTAMGLSDLPAEVAIDDDDRLRRVTFTVDLATIAQASGRTLPGAAPTEMVLTVELFDFGTPVDVEAPPEAEVVDAPAPDLLEPST